MRDLGQRLDAVRAAVRVRGATGSCGVDRPDEGGGDVRAVEEPEAELEGVRERLEGLQRRIDAADDGGADRAADMSNLETFVRAMDP